MRRIKLLLVIVMTACLLSAALLGISGVALAAEEPVYTTTAADFAFNKYQYEIQKLNDAVYTANQRIKVVVPSEIDGVPVKKIGGFSNKTQIVELDLSQANNLEIINSFAFSKTSIGGAVVFPGSVTKIDRDAFNGCASLEAISLNEGLTDIGQSAFSSCTSLTGNLVLPSTLRSIGASAFVNCKQLTGALTIPDSVTAIGGSAFNGCSGFDGSLTLPDNTELTVIEASTFNGCSNLTGPLTIPGSVETIGKDAFINCKKLSGSLTIPDSVTAIGQSAFSGCSGFDGTLTLSANLSSIASTAFYGCSFTGDLTIPDSVTEIAGSAFGACKGFDGKLTLSKNALFTTIETKLFDSCNFTGDLVIPDNITTIKDNAFANIKFGGTLTLSENLSSIGVNAFNNCVGLTGDLTLPDSLVSAGTGAFSGCVGFNGNLKLSKGLTAIPNLFFSGCTKMTGTIEIPETVVSIGDNAFGNNSAFSGLTFLTDDRGISKIETIGANAFSGCYVLSGSIVLPKSVTAIMNNAFAGCSSVNNFRLNAGVTYGSNVFATVNGRVVNAYLIAENAEAYQALTRDLSAYAAKVTYEILLTYTNGGLQEQKLFNQAISLYQDEQTMLWHENREYTFPHAAMPNKKHIGWAFTDGGEKIEKNSLVTAGTLFPLYEFLPMIADYTEGKGYTLSGFHQSYLDGLDDPANVKLEIPEVWNDGVNGDAPVVAIAKNAFLNKSQIKGVVFIPEGITRIDDYAFKGCSGITDFYLPASLLNVGKGILDDTAAMIVAPDKDSYQTLSNSGLAKYSKLTYEFTVTFYHGDTVVSAQQKAYNQDIRYVKDTATSHWSINESYVLPTVEIPDGNSWAGWIKTQDISDSAYLTVSGANEHALAISPVYYAKLFSDPIDLGWLMILFGGVDVMLLVALTLIFIMIYIKGVKYKAKKNSRKLYSLAPLLLPVIVPPAAIASQVAIVITLASFCVIEIVGLVLLLFKMRSDRKKRLAKDLGEEDIDTSAVMIDRI